jgi:hypothetical protein
VSALALCKHLPQAKVYGSTNIFPFGTTEDAVRAVAAPRIHQGYSSGIAVGAVEAAINPNLYANASEAIGFVDSFRGVALDPTAALDGASKPYQSPMTNEEVFVLPERATADHVMGLFRDLALPLLPVVPLGILNSAYDSVWTNEAAPNASDHALVNICLALATRFGQQLEGGTEADLDVAEQYYARARQLVAVDATEASNMRTVQILVLMSMYGQAVASANRAWNTLGTAVRMAMALGMHMDRPPTGDDDLMLVEQRRRIWWACYCLDTCVATAGFLHPSTETERTAS